MFNIITNKQRGYICKKSLNNREKNLRVGLFMRSLYLSVLEIIICALNRKEQKNRIKIYFGRASLFDI